jgi:hypothetical protein
VPTRDSRDGEVRVEREVREEKVEFLDWWRVWRWKRDIGVRRGRCGNGGIAGEGGFDGRKRIHRHVVDGYVGYRFFLRRRLSAE